MWKHPQQTVLALDLCREPGAAMGSRMRGGTTHGRFLIGRRESGEGPIRLNYSSQIALRGHSRLCKSDTTLLLCKAKEGSELRFPEGTGCVQRCPWPWTGELSVQNRTTETDRCADTWMRSVWRASGGKFGPGERGAVNNGGSVCIVSGSK